MVARRARLRLVRALHALRLGCAAILVLGLILSVALPVFAAENDRQPPVGSIVFNIPPQPLGSALETYARISSREVLYDSMLADGRRSSLVDGVYTPEVALQILLAGTGLLADFKDRDFFVVGPAPAETSVRAAVGMRSAEDTRYYGRLQAKLKAAFCASRVVPDDYRVAARLWIGQQGVVLQARALTSVGSELGRQVEAILRGLRLGSAPPVGFAQPITIVIMPGDAKRDCETAPLLPATAGP
jgi:hypothetical protein